MRSIYFRTDGNEEIATGHIMRCLSIARACVPFNAKITFVVSDQKSESVLRERFEFQDEFHICCLNSDYRNLEHELPLLQSILKDASCFLIDSYFVTEAYLTEVRKLCYTAYLDDMLSFEYPVDLIINYDEIEEPSCYRKAAHKLLGAAYAPLRMQFKDVPYEVRTTVHDIFISTGGTDAYDISGMLLNKILNDDELKNYCYHIITSRLNSYFTELQQLTLVHANIHIHENIKDIAALMRGCDLAVSAGGTTLYELCAVGVPSVSFITADNQQNAVKVFRNKKIISCAGDVRLSPDETVESIISFLKCTAISYDKRRNLSLDMRKFIDGKGSYRIAEALIHS